MNDEITFEFNCKMCDHVWKDMAVGETSMESECLACGNWEYREANNE